MKAAEEPGSYTVNSVNPFRIEGQKTIPYRARNKTLPLNNQDPIGTSPLDSLITCFTKPGKLETIFV